MTKMRHEWTTCLWFFLLKWCIYILMWYSMSNQIVLLVVQIRYMPAVRGSLWIGVETRFEYGGSLTGVGSVHWSGLCTEELNLFSYLYIQFFLFTAEWDDDDDDDGWHVLFAMLASCVSLGVFLWVPFYRRGHWYLESLSNLVKANLT